MTSPDPFFRRCDGLVVLLVLCVASVSLAVSPPGILNHQGRIAVSGTNFDGTGYFKFALVDGSGGTLWSNDGTSTTGDEPVAAVTGAVTQGHYAVGLGDAALANMVVIPAPVFADHAEVRLRIWFSTDNATFELLTPDRRITSAGYALSAGTAQGVADGAVTASMLADGAVTTPKLAAAAVTVEKVSPSYQVGRAADGNAGLDLSGLTGGSASFTTTFRVPFAPGTVPEIHLPEGWSLSGVASETGFAATSSFAPVTVDSGGSVGRYASLAVVDGRPAISYYDDTNDDLKYVIASDASGAVWEVPVTVDSAGAVGRHTSLAVVDGRPAISYYDATNDDLKYVIATDASGTAWEEPVTVDSEGAVGFYTSLAVVDGRPAISYYDATNIDLKYVIATDASGTAWEVPVTVDSEGSVGRDTSLAVVDGRPAISYYDDTNGDLKYVIASDASGAVWEVPVTVDSAGNVGRDTSLAVVDGRPAISYYDATNDDLKYVIATDVSGGAWGFPVTVDSVGSVGSYTSLAVVDGRPTISYYDSTNLDLKYAALPSLNDWSATDPGQARAPVLAESAAGVTDSAITSASLAAGAVTGAAIADGTIGVSHIAEGTIRSWHIAQGAIGSAHIVDGTLTAAKLDATSVGMWSVNGSDVFRDGGSVGIGSGSPAAALHVQAVPVPSKGQLVLVDPDDPSTETAAAGALSAWGNDIGSGSAGRLWYLGSSSSGTKNITFLNSLPLGDLTLATDGTDRVRVAADGKVGIGSGGTTLRADLQVHGAPDGSKGQIAVVDGDHASTDVNSFARLSGWGSNIGSGSTGRLWFVGSTGTTSHNIALWNQQAGSVSFVTNNTEAMRIDEFSKVGIGTTSPGSQLEIVSPRELTDSTGTAFLAIGGTNGVHLAFDFDEIQMYSGNNPGSSLFPLNINTRGGDVNIGKAGSTTTIFGTFTNASDREAKEDFSEVNGEAVLERLVGLPLTTWRYKGSEDRRHVGPMAQDFHAAFDDLLELNSDDKTIAPLDEAGVAFASIQALNAKVEKENEALRRENANLQERLEKLERAMSRWMKAESGVLKSPNP